MPVDDRATREPLLARVEAHLAAAHGGNLRVTAIEPLAGGACQDNFRIDAMIGDAQRRFVLRSDAESSLPGSIGRREEQRVIERAVAAGVKTPPARWLGEGLVRAGGAAYFLDWVDGDAIARKVLAAPQYATARERLPEQLAAELAKIHSIRGSEPEAARLLSSGQGPDPSADPAATAVTLARRMLDEIASRGDHHPALELAVAWLDANRPPAGEVVLCHGDFRTGNFLVGPAGLEAVLDWEFAHWGVREQDIAWLCLRDWRFGVLDKPVGGFARREPFYEAYERHSGVAPDPVAVHYWEVMGNVWWASGAVHQAVRYRAAARKDFELIAIARRAAEMEYEALRLIERGVS